MFNSCWLKYRTFQKLTVRFRAKNRDDGECEGKDCDRQRDRRKDDDDFIIPKGGGGFGKHGVTSEEEYFYFKGVEMLHKIKKALKERRKVINLEKARQEGDGQQAQEQKMDAHPHEDQRYDPPQHEQDAHQEMPPQGDCKADAGTPRDDKWIDCETSEEKDHPEDHPAPVKGPKFPVIDTHEEGKIPTGYGDFSKHGTTSEAEYFYWKARDQLKRIKKDILRRKKKRCAKATKKREEEEN